MIFVTVGTQPKGFLRFVKNIEELIREGLIKDKVLIQLGYTHYTSNLFDSFDFISDEKFKQCMLDADLIITHAGSGAIFNAMRLNKKIIVFPRLSKFGEVLDDHQLELTKKLGEDGFIIDGQESLHEALIIAEHFVPKSYNFNQSLIPNLISYIDNL